MNQSIFVPLSLCLFSMLWVPPPQAQVLHEFVSPEPSEHFMGGFGYAVSGGIDVDYDGFEDVVVSEPTNKVYVFSGSNGRILHTFTFPEGEGGHFFGSAVAGAGDVDGDLWADIAVGAYEADPYDDGGKVYVFSGRTGDLLHVLSSPNGQNSGEFGFSVARVGDLDNDTCADIVVGARGENPGWSPNGAGRAYVFSGATGALIHEMMSPNEQAQGYFGWAVCGAGDINDDGFKDIIVGAYREDPGSNPLDAGQAYVYSGMDGGLLHAFSSPNAETAGHFGMSVAGAGELNGDACDDIIVGAPGEAPGSSPTGAGRAYVFSGSDGSLLHTLRAPSECFHHFFGYSVAGIGDVNSDGMDEIIVGVSGRTPNPSPETSGRAYLFDGYSGTCISVLISPHEVVNGHFGLSVATAGDVNNDGKPDVLIGASLETVDLIPEAGRVYVFSATEVGIDERPEWCTELSMIEGPFPNPTTGQVRFIWPVGSTGGSDIQLRLYDVAGRLVDTAIAVGAAGEDRINIVWTPDQELNSGLYLWHIVVGEERTTRHIIIGR